MYYKVTYVYNVHGQTDVLQRWNNGSQHGSWRTAGAMNWVFTRVLPSCLTRYNLAGNGEG
jgi:hypothetical protein